MDLGDTAPSTEVAQLLALLDRAFADGGWHSLLMNLRTTLPTDWERVPTGGARSIRSIVQHVGGCKVMYENAAFGDTTLRRDHPLVNGAAQTHGLPAAMK